MKLAVMGGGSSYSPELVDGLFPPLGRDSGNGSLDDGPQPPIGWRSPRVWPGECRRATVRRLRCTRPTNMREAVKDAKYVVSPATCRWDAGAYQRRKAWIEVRHRGPGDDGGVGGMACALRTIPRILDIARAMEELSPKGYLINFTNPSGIVTESLIKHSSIKSFGPVQHSYRDYNGRGEADRLQDGRRVDGLRGG